MRAKSVEIHRFIIGRGEFHVITNIEAKKRFLNR